MDYEHNLTDELEEDFPEEAAAMGAGILTAESLLNGHNEPLPLPGLNSDGNGQADEENAEWTLWGLLDWF